MEATWVATGCALLRLAATFPGAMTLWRSVQRPSHTAIGHPRGRGPDGYGGGRGRGTGHRGRPRRTRRGNGFFRGREGEGRRGPRGRRAGLAPARAPPPRRTAGADFRTAERRRRFRTGLFRRVHPFFPVRDLDTDRGRGPARRPGHGPALSRSREVPRPAGRLLGTQVAPRYRVARGTAWFSAPGRGGCGHGLRRRPSDRAATLRGPDAGSRSRRGCAPRPEDPCGSLRCSPGHRPRPW